MTRETRIALLVGLAIIILFGLVLGQRSMKVAPGSGESLPISPAPAPGPELRTAQLDAPGRPVLAPAARPAPSPPARAIRPAPGTGVRPPIAGRSAPPAPVRRPTPPTPARVPAPVAPARTYTVRPGDNLIAIARKVYGRAHGDEYQRIYLANRDRLADESTVAPGQVLKIPPLQGASGRAVAVRPAPPAPAPAPRRHYREMTLEAMEREFSPRPRTYTVRNGDCLTAIARRTMGDGSRRAVRKLYEANRDRISDPNRLSVGQTLRIPG